MISNTRQKEFEMRVFKRLTAVVLAGMMGAAGIGCSSDVDQEDVTAAREKLIEEERETQLAIQEANENIAEEEKETEAARRQVENPDRSKLLEEERETAEAREEAEKKIREEKQETREARQKLVELETKLAAQRERDSYLTERELLLTTASVKLESLKQEAVKQEGAAKEATQKQIESIQQAYDELSDAVAAMKKADPLEWKVEKAATEAAYVELLSLLKDLSV